MAARTIFVPVGYAEAADRIACLVERGVIRVQPHWLSREACQSFLDSLPSFQRNRYAPTAAVVRVAEGAQQSRTGLHADARRCDCAAISLGAPLAGDVGRAGASLALSSVSMTERRDGACVSGRADLEGRHAA